MRTKTYLFLVILRKSNFFIEGFPLTDKRKLYQTYSNIKRFLVFLVGLNFDMRTLSRDPEDMYEGSIKWVNNFFLFDTLL